MIDERFFDKFNAFVEYEVLQRALNADAPLDINRKATSKTLSSVRKPLLEVAMRLACEHDH